MEERDCVIIEDSVAVSVSRTCWMNDHAAGYESEVSTLVQKAEAQVTIGTSFVPRHFKLKIRGFIN